MEADEGVYVTWKDFEIAYARIRDSRELLLEVPLQGHSHNPVFRFHLGGSSSAMATVNRKCGFVVPHPKFSD